MKSWNFEHMFFSKLFCLIATITFVSAVPTFAQGIQCGVTQLTSSSLGFGSVGTSAGSFSANNGKRIVFTSTADLAGANPEHNPELFFYDDGIGYTQITDTEGAPGGSGAGNGTISSDGKKVVFMSYADYVGENPDGNDELFLYDDDAGGIRQITHTTSFGWLGIGVISPNGNLVAFNSERDFAGQNGDGNMEIFTYDIATETFSQITNTIGKSSGLWAVSADGSRLSIMSNADLVNNFNLDGNYEVFVHSASSGFIQVSVTSAAFFNSSPFMSEDGDHVAYISNAKYLGNPDGNNEVYIYDLPNSALTQVTNTTGNTQIQTASVSGDGNRILFISNRNLTGTNADQNEEIYMYDRSAGSIVQVSDTQAPVPNYRAEISSDGKRIFWDSSGYPLGNADGNREIFMAECVPPPSADLHIGLSADRLSAKQGEKITYTITVNNFGPNDASGVVVNDVLSSGSTFVSAQANKGSFTAPVPGQTGTVTWYPGTIANGTSTSAQIKVTVIVKGKTSISNTASATSGTGDPNLTNNTATVATVIASGSGGKK